MKRLTMRAAGCKRGPSWAGSRPFTRQALLSPIPRETMRIARTRTTQFVCYLALLFAGLFLAAEQDGFTDAEADGIKAFLHDNFRQTNTCMVIGLADQRGNRNALMPSASASEAVLSRSQEQPGE